MQSSGQELVFVGEVVEQHAVAGSGGRCQGSKGCCAQAFQQEMIGHSLDGGFSALASDTHAHTCSRCLCILVADATDMLCSTRYAGRTSGQMGFWRTFRVPKTACKQTSKIC